MKRASRRGLHGQVLSDLGERIVRGPWGPGTVIDVDALVLELDVSRTTVREVLKSLADKGLVDARPKVGTFVCEVERWNYLDADVMAWRASGPLDERLAQSLVQVRSVLEPGAAGLAAEHRTEEDVAALRRAVEDLAEAVPLGPQATAEADLSLHRAILAATGNELLLQFEVVLEPALRSRHDVALRNVRDLSFITLHRDVVDAIVGHDVDGATEAMRVLLRNAEHDLDEALTAHDTGAATPSSAGGPTPASGVGPTG